MKRKNQFPVAYRVVKIVFKAFGRWKWLHLGVFNFSANVFWRLFTWEWIRSTSTEHRNVRDIYRMKYSGETSIIVGSCVDFQGAFELEKLCKFLVMNFGNEEIFRKDDPSASFRLFNWDILVRVMPEKACRFNIERLWIVMPGRELFIPIHVNAHLSLQEWRKFTLKIADMRWAS